jgi:hypothetical protein
LTCGVQVKRGEWLWEQFSKAGYVTSFGENHCVEDRISSSRLFAMRLKQGEAGNDTRGEQLLHVCIILYHMLCHQFVLTLADVLSTLSHK